MSDPNVLKGRQAMQAGNHEQASAFFAAALQLDPANEEAWLLFGDVISDPQKRRFCYRRVLELNPANQQALANLELLGAPYEIPAGLGAYPEPADETMASIPVEEAPAVPVRSAWRPLPEAEQSTADTLPSANAWGLNTIEPQVLGLTAAAETASSESVIPLSENILSEEESTDTPKPISTDDWPASFFADLEQESAAATTLPASAAWHPTSAAPEEEQPVARTLPATNAWYPAVVEPEEELPAVTSLPPVNAWLPVTREPVEESAVEPADLPVNPWRATTAAPVTDSFETSADDDWPSSIFSEPDEESPAPSPDNLPASAWSPVVAEVEETPAQPAAPAKSSRSLRSRKSTLGFLLYVFPIMLVSLLVTACALLVWGLSLSY